MSNSIPLTLEWFPKKGDLLVDKETCCIDFGLVMQLLEIDKSYDPMLAYVYDVPEKFAGRLQPYYKHKIDLTLYDYSVCVYSTNTCP